MWFTKITWDREVKDWNTCTDLPDCPPSKMAKIFKVRQTLSTDIATILMIRTHIFPCLPDYLHFCCLHFLFYVFCFLLLSSILLAYQCSSWHFGCILGKCTEEQCATHLAIFRVHLLMDVSFNNYHDNVFHCWHYWLLMAKPTLKIIII